MVHNKFTLNLSKETKKALSKLPAKMANVAERHFKDSFRKKGFTDRGFHRWPGRQHEGRGSLMIESGALKRSVRKHRITRNMFEIIAGDNKVNYAETHNEGLTVHPTVTPQMRKFAFAKYKETGDSKWKGIALTKKSHLTIKMPKRKFMGKSHVLDANTNKLIIKELNKVLK